MSAPKDRAQEPPEPPGRVYREPSAQITGIFVIVLLVALAVLYIVTSDEWVRPLCFLLSAILLVWVLLVRPSVRLERRGVVLDNLVRRVLVPWRLIDLTETRWNLRLVTHDGREFGAWAVSARRPKSKVGGLPSLRGPVSEPGASTEPGDEHRQGSAGHVAARISAGIEEYERAVRQGMEPGDDDVTVTPVWPAIAALVAAVALFLGWVVS